MDLTVFLLVVAAAVMHAAWNVLLKVGRDGLVSIALMQVSASAFALALLPFVTWPQPAAWPWLLTSVALHLGYNLFLVQAYRFGDLAQVYPIARGAAPVLVAAVTAALMSGEPIGPIGYVGIVMLGAGVVLMSFRGGRDLQRLEPVAVGYALATSMFIAGYTLVDGLGARAGGAADGYAVWLFLLNGPVFIAVTVVHRRAELAIPGPASLASGLAGGAMLLAAYWIVIWAMTVAPIPLVAALRETSVLFAATLAALLLGEPMTRWRIVAAGVIVTAAIAMRLG